MFSMPFLFHDVFLFNCFYYILNMYLINSIYNIILFILFINTCFCKTALYAAAGRDKREIMEILLNQHDIDVNAKSILIILFLLH